MLSRCAEKNDLCDMIFEAIMARDGRRNHGTSNDAMAQDRDCATGCSIGWLKSLDMAPNPVDIVEDCDCDRAEVSKRV